MDTGTFTTFASGRDVGQAFAAAGTGACGYVVVRTAPACLAEAREIAERLVAMGDGRLGAASGPVGAIRALGIAPNGGRKYDGWLFFGVAPS